MSPSTPMTPAFPGSLSATSTGWSIRLDLPLWALRERVLAAARAAFIPPKERQRLVYDLSKEFSQKML